MARVRTAVRYPAAFQRTGEKVVAGVSLPQVFRGEFRCGPQGTVADLGKAFRALTIIGIALAAPVWLALRRRLHQTNAGTAFGGAAIATALLIFLCSATGCSSAPNAASSYPKFPWPPPPASAEIVVPNGVLLAGLPQAVRLGDIDHALVHALQHAGYYQNAYYEVPHGFALVARLERIHQDGSPYQGLARFNSEFSPLPEFSLSEYLHALFQAPTGYYRVIVFIISDAPFASSGTPVSSQDADMWIEHGANTLPPRIARMTYSTGYVCTSLIYEFEKHDARSNPVADHPGPLSADAHLTKAGIAEGLKWPLP